MTNLPNLEGSEKQIAWAEDIRKEYIERVEKYKVIRGTDEDEGLRTILGLRENVDRKEKNQIKKELGLAVTKEERKALSKEEQKAQGKELREELFNRRIKNEDTKIEEKLAETSAKVWIENRI